MVEAQNLRDQFDGWAASDRDEKLRRLAAVIEGFRPVSFQFSLSRLEFDQYVKPHSPRPLAKPHFDCIFGVICMMANWSHQSGLRVPIDFIFDDQEGISADVHLFFEQMTKSLAPPAKALINGIPIFRNDRQFMPLQAADMLAWHLRREHETQETWPLLSVLRKPGAHFLGEIPSEMLRRHGEEFKTIPGAPQVQSKAQWRRLRRIMFQAAEMGFVPPPNKPKESSLDYVRRCLESLLRFGKKND
jgi:hypothetical protein